MPDSRGYPTYEEALRRDFSSRAAAKPDMTAWQHRFDLEQEVIDCAEGRRHCGREECGGHR